MRTFHETSAPLYALHSELHSEMIELRKLPEYMYSPEYLTLSAAQQSVSSALESLRAHAAVVQVMATN